MQKLADNTKTVRRSQPLVREEIESMSEEKLEMELRSRKPTDRDLNTIRKHLLMKFCSSGVSIDAFIDIVTLTLAYTVNTG